MVEERSLAVYAGAAAFFGCGSGADGAGVEEEGGGAGVFEGDEHVGAEGAGGEGDGGLAEGVEEEVEELAAEVWAGGWVEAGAAAFGGFRGDGEVADDQEAAMGGLDVEVEVFVGIGEDAEGQEFAGEPLSVGGGIVCMDGGEDGETGADVADDGAVDGDGGGGDALDDGDHGDSPI